jgi:hypothetical protein
MQMPNNKAHKVLSNFMDKYKVFPKLSILKMQMPQ